MIRDDYFYQPWVQLGDCKRYGKGMFTTIHPEMAAVVAQKRREHEAEMKQRKNER